MNPNLRNVVIALNQQGFSFFALAKLNAVSVYAADYYENYDFDIVIPDQRQKLLNLLSAQGYRQLTGRTIANVDKSVVFEFPKPNFTLGDDPVTRAQKLLDKSRTVVVLTPTQALLIYIKRFYQCIMTELSHSSVGEISQELLDLVYEQPANLEKVHEWLGPSDQTDAFGLLQQRLQQSQRLGLKQRAEQTFVSRMLKRLAD